jgi:hypothetical protein
MINLGCTAGTIILILNRHAAWRNRTSTICTSIVYAHMTGLLRYFSFVSKFLSTYFGKGSVTTRRPNYLNYYAAWRRRNKQLFLARLPCFIWAKPSVGVNVKCSWHCIFFPLPGACCVTNATVPWAIKATVWHEKCTYNLMNATSRHKTHVAQKLKTTTNSNRSTSLFELRQRNIQWLWWGERKWESEWEWEREIERGLVVDE